MPGDGVRPLLVNPVDLAARCFIANAARAAAEVDTDGEAFDIEDFGEEEEEEEDDDDLGDVEEAGDNMAAGFKLRAELLMTLFAAATAAAIPLVVVELVLGLALLLEALVEEGRGELEGVDVAVAVALPPMSLGRIL